MQKGNRSLVVLALAVSVSATLSCGGEGTQAELPEGERESARAWLSPLVSLLPGGSSRVAEMSRGFERSPSGSLRTKPLPTASLEAWISAELQDDGRGTVRYRYRESPGLWIDISPTVIDLAPIQVSTGGALLGHGEGTTRALLASARGVEEFWVVSESKALPSLRYSMRLGSGLDRVLLDPAAGDLVVSDKAGEPRFEIRHVVAFDSAGQRRDAQWSLSRQPELGVYEIAASVDAQGLVFPVVVDPTVNVPSWIKKTPAVKPPQLAFVNMTYDLGRDRIVLFGGRNQTLGADVNDVWEWNGSTWDNRTPAGPNPSPRQISVFGYVPSIGKTLLRSGYVCMSPDGNTTWGWDGSSWSVLENADAPSCSVWGPGQTYDSARGKLVVFGDGYTGSDNVYEYQAGWTKPNPSTRPAGRGSLVMFFDTTLNRSLIFSGGFSGSAMNDTWGWNGVNWVQYATAGAPSPRDRAVGAWDSDRLVGVVFGGQNGCCTTFQDTYEWYNLDWHAVSTSLHPPTSRSAGFAYDSVRKEMVYFGGFRPDTNTYSDETWVYKILQYKTDGEPCTQSMECLHSNCVDGVCCDSYCGGGAASDCLACSVAKGAAADGACGPIQASAAFVCRIAAGPCDSPEICEGSATSCPSNSFLPSTTVCRAAQADCDQVELCNGSSAQCPADASAPNGTVCRAASGPCDNPEVCDGVSASCPADSVKASTVICRDAAGSCDTPEHCLGVGTDCPADGVLPSGTVCRGLAGNCDIEESCDGVAKSCPADSLVAQGVVCRAASDACDTPESCTGASGQCPADAVQAAGMECRGAAGDCDSVESCDGSSKSCPADSFLPATTLCRPAASACDSEELCTGASATCPQDMPQSDGTSCPGADACVIGATCQAGVCSAGTPKDCTDGDACTADSCDPATGCQHTAIPNCGTGGSAGNAGGGGAAGASIGGSGGAGTGGSATGGAGGTGTGGSGGTSTGGSGGTGTGGTSTGGAAGAPVGGAAGTMGIGGSAGGGGLGGTGATSAGGAAGGIAGSAGADSPLGKPEEDNAGCGCRTAPVGRVPFGALALLALSVLARSGRKRSVSRARSGDF